MLLAVCQSIYMLYRTMLRLLVKPLFLTMLRLLAKPLFVYDASPACEASDRNDASPAGDATDPTVSATGYISFAVLSASTPVCDNIAYAVDNVLPLAVSNADELGQTVSRHRNPARNKKMHFTDSWHASPVTKVHCVCRSDLDNSRMIQCEKCYRWFHCSCLSLKQVFIYRQC